MSASENVSWIDWYTRRDDPSLMTREAEDWKYRALEAESALESIRGELAALRSFHNAAVHQRDAAIAELGSAVEAAEVRGARWTLEERAHLLLGPDRDIEAERVCRSGRKRDARR